MQWDWKVSLVISIDWGLKFENLYLLPAAQTRDKNALTEEQMAELCERLRESFDYIIIDSSPLGKVPDALHLASLADSTILVQRSNFSLQEMLRITIDDLKYSNIINVSITLNDLGSEYTRYGY